MEFITMALPTTGPITRYTGTSTAKYERKQIIRRQAPPYNLPLAYQGWSRRVLLASPELYFDTQSQVLGVWVPNSVTQYQYFINEVASKLRGKVSDTALWAVNLAEYHQAVGMMTNRLVQVSRLAHALLKRDVSGAFKAIGFDGKKTKGGLRKKFADTWLEWSFGWSPLIADIYSTIDLLQNPIKAVHLRASKTFPVAYTYGSGTTIWDRHTITGKDFCRMGCEVTINNPNLYLANNLGLANPAVVIWELIPFSFCVDWFANVGQFLQSGSDWYGLTVTNPYTTYGTVRTGVREGYNPWDHPPYSSSIMKAAWMERRPEILETQLVVKPWKIWGWQRAANAAAVVSQLLSPFKLTSKERLAPVFIRD